MSAFGRAFFRERWVCVVIACAVAAYAYVALVVFKSFPYSMDEHGYLYQARLFAHLQRYVRVDGLPPALRDLYFVWHGGKSFSKYPQGFPLLLALGVLAHAPALVNPLIAGLSLWLVFRIAGSFVGRGAALAAMILMATSPYSFGYSASFFSQAAALMMTLAAFACLRSWQLRRRSRDLRLLGAVLGFAILVRPLDALCVMVPCGVVLLVDHVRKRELVKLLEWTVPIAAVLLLLLAYNRSLSGRWGLVTYPVVGREFQVVATGASPSVWAAYVRGLRENVSPLFWTWFLPYVTPFPLFAAAVGLFERRLGSWRLLLVAQIALVILLYNFHHTDGWPHYGARYWYSTFGSVAILGAGGIHLLWSAVMRRAAVPRRIPSSLVAFLIVAVTVQLLCATQKVAIWRYDFEIVEATRADIDKVCGRDGIVWIQNTLRIVSPSRFVVWRDLKRNASSSGDRWFVLTPEENQSVSERFPAMRKCQYDLRERIVRRELRLPLLNRD